MKRKNTKIWTVVIISVQLLLLCSAITNANAWKNGATSSGHVTEALILNWRAGGHYGTHDGIAEAALDAVRVDAQAQPWKVSQDEGQQGQNLDFWDVRRTIIFLIGTEAPDMSPSQVSMTLNKQRVTGRRTSRRHNIWFNRYDAGNPNSMKIQIPQIMNTLNDYTVKAETALKNGKCDLAAFYIGCCSHLIADLSNWLHTISWENLKQTWDPAYGYNMQEWDPPYLNDKYPFSDMVQKLHGQFEYDILKYTNTKTPQLFTYPRNFRVSPTGIKNPREIALELAFSSRFDREATVDQINGATIGLTEGPYNALRMFHSSYTINDLTNDYIYRKIEQQSGLYKQQVDNLLDNGVKAVAKLIDYFGTVWNATPRICKGCMVDEKVENQLGISRAVMLGISMFIFMGIAMTFFSSIILVQLKSAMKKEESPL